jgi:hypothetical protein
MKKIIILSVATLFFSCQKENLEPTKPITVFSQQCNCGLVISADASNHTIVLRNSCTGNDKVFGVSPNEWGNAYVGSNYCVTNAIKW